MENLELFIIGLMKVIALDSTIVNPRSPANGEAARWYVNLQGQQPQLFPTVPLSALTAEPEPPKIGWRNIK